MQRSLEKTIVLYPPVRPSLRGDCGSPNRLRFVGTAFASALAYLGSLTTMLVLSQLRMPLRVSDLVGIHPATAWRETGGA